MDAMKKSAFILLLVLFSAICYLLTIVVLPSDSDIFLIALDVCDTSGSFMSEDADSLAIQECSLNIVPPVFSGYIEKANFVFNPSLIISKQERPPRV
jgi:hypothetical protein